MKNLVTIAGFNMI